MILHTVNASYSTTCQPSLYPPPTSLTVMHFENGARSVCREQEPIPLSHRTYEDGLRTLQLAFEVIEFFFASLLTHLYAAAVERLVSSQRAQMGRVPYILPLIGVSCCYTKRFGWLFAAVQIAYRKGEYCGAFGCKRLNISRKGWWRPKQRRRNFTKTAQCINKCLPSTIFCDERSFLQVDSFRRAIAASDRKGKEGYVTQSNSFNSGVKTPTPPPHPLTSSLDGRA